MKIPFSFSPLFFTLGLALVIGLNYGSFVPTTQSSDSSEKTTEYTVEKGNITTSIEVVGVAGLVNEQQLSFNQAGDISKVLVKPGDTIKKNQVIAEIDNADALLSIDDAKIRVDNAKLSLRSLYDGVDDSKLLQTQNSIESSQKNLSLAKKELANIKADQQKTVNEDSQNILNLKKDLENLKTTQKNTLDKMLESLNISQKELENYKTIQKDSLDKMLNSSNIGEKELENFKISQKNSLNKALESLNVSKKELSIAEKNLEVSKKDFAVSKKQQDQSLDNTEVNKNSSIIKIEDNFKSDISKIEEIIENADIILGVTSENKRKNDDYEGYLGAKDSVTKGKARGALQESILLFKQLKIDMDDYNNNGERQDLEQLLQRYQNLFQKLYQTTDLLYKTVEASIISVGSLSQNQVDSMKTISSSGRSIALSKISTINSSLTTLQTLTDTGLLGESNSNSLESKQNSLSSAELSLEKKRQDLANATKEYETTKKNNEIALEKKIQDLQSSTKDYQNSQDTNTLSVEKKQQDLTNASKDYQTAKNNHKIALERKQLDITKAQNNYNQTVKNNAIILESRSDDLRNKEKSINLSKVTLKELKEGPTSENIKKAKNAVTQAEIGLKTTQEKLEDYKLTSPFDGVVRKIDYQVGDKLTNDTQKYVYIENPNLLEIVVLLDQIDIVKVEKNFKADITFDAYPTMKVPAKISSIDTTPLQSSGVVSYEVTLVLDDPSFKKKVLSGMTSDIEIYTLSKKDILLVKTSAISERRGANYVTLKRDGIPVQQEVEIGMNKNGMTEIISGLEQGDTVIIQQYSADTSKDGEAESLFKRPAGTGQGRGGNGGGGFRGGGNR